MMWINRYNEKSVGNYPYTYKGVEIMHPTKKVHSVKVYAMFSEYHKNGGFWPFHLWVVKNGKPSNDFEKVIIGIKFHWLKISDSGIIVTYYRTRGK